MKYNILKDSAKRQPELVLLKWLDHSTFKKAEWHEFDQATELSPVTFWSVGWIIREESDYVVLANTSDRSECTHGEFCIIKKAILERIPLKDPSTKETKRK